MKFERLLCLYSGFHLFLLIGIIPEWAVVIALGAWALGVIAVERKRPWPSWLVQVFAGLGFVATFALVRPYFGIENSACLAAWVLAFQVHVLKNPRARLTQLFVCLFALSIFLVNRASNLNLLIMLIDLVMFFALLNQSQGLLQGSSQGMTWSTLRSAFRMVLLTFPVWILIFFLFPRFTLSLWTGQGSATAKSGFSDELRPGLVGRVIQSDEVAFRFRFDIPQNENYFYFRGAVMADPQSGLHWRQGPTSLLFRDEIDEQAGFDHEVWLEPRWGRHLFAAEFAQSLKLGLGFGSPDVEATGASIFQLKTSPNRLVSYRARSTPADIRTEISQEEREYLTQLPEAVVTDLQKIKKAPRLKGLAAPAAIDALNHWFLNQGFRYSMDVNVVPSEKLSVFLNDEKIGFCEHYAASAVALLRNAGIPARVVVGFLGGSYNPIAETYGMFDRDAHAWTEYYDEQEKRWERYDPTAIIQPLRLSLGGEMYRLSPEELDQAAKGFRSENKWSQFWERMNLFWDAWGHEIERRIVFYDASWMSKMYQDWGLYEWGPWITGTAALVLGAMLLSFLRVFLRQRGPRSASEKVLVDIRKHFLIPRQWQGEEETLMALMPQAAPHTEALETLKDNILKLRYSALHLGERRSFERSIRGQWNQLKRSTAQDGTRELVRKSWDLKMERREARHGDQRRAADKPSAKSVISEL